MQQGGPLLCSGDDLHTGIMHLGHQGFLRRPSSGHDREDGFKSWGGLITHLSRIVVSIFADESGNFDKLPPFLIGWIFHGTSSLLCLSIFNYGHSPVFATVNRLFSKMPISRLSLPLFP